MGEVCGTCEKCPGENTWVAIRGVRNVCARHMPTAIAPPMHRLFPGPDCLSARSIEKSVLCKRSIFYIFVPFSLSKVTKMSLHLCIASAMAIDSPPLEARRKLLIGSY